jgi:hypothetical protein
MALRDYIAQQLEEMDRQDTIDWYAEADRVIAKILDPDYTPPKDRPKKKQTKVDSYTRFLEEYQSGTYQKIFDIIASSDEPLSRAEIAARGQMRVATVCGRVAELIEAEAISVVGKKLDEDSNREVEVLSNNFVGKGK